MSITLSNSAAAQVNTFLANRSKKFSLRLSVKTSKCSSIAYVLKFVNKPTPKNIVFKNKSVKVVVNSKSLQFLNSTQLNFVKKSLNKKFKFTNPNVKNKCSCSKSFHV